MKVSSIVDQIEIYKSLGIESTDNMLGARRASAVWTDATGNDFVFGGVWWSQDDIPAHYFNDLHQFSIVCSFRGNVDDFGNCHSCSRGKFSQNLNARNCSNCLSRASSNSYGSTFCSEFPIVSFNEVEGLSFCQICMPVKYSTSSSFLNCSSGKFSTQGVCLTCTPGRFQMNHHLLSV
jgi:hypothetical protein